MFENYLLEHEHYFGAVVVLKKTNKYPALRSFVVIDDQQRITAVYLLIDKFGLADVVFAA
jgi:uncharacterized protein with ParB-like and HNH nuclease domain